MDKFEKIALALLIFFGITVLSTFVYLGESITGSIFPELVGFSLEGVFLVILFSWYQKRQHSKRELARKIELKWSLRAELSIFFQWAQPLDSDLGTLPYWNNPDVVKTLVKELEENGELCVVQPDFLRDFSVREIPDLQSMLPIAASIDSKHMWYWSLIINNIKGIAASENDEKTYKALMEFLKYVTKFDELEINA